MNETKNSAAIAGLERIMSKSTVDSDYRASLLSDPMGTLAAAGFHVPEGVTVEFCESTKDKLVVPLPPAQTEELSLDQLESVSGGWNFNYTFEEYIYKMFHPDAQYQEQ